MSDQDCRCICQPDHSHNACREQADPSQMISFFFCQYRHREQKFITSLPPPDQRLGDFVFILLHDNGFLFIRQMCCLRSPYRLQKPFQIFFPKSMESASLNPVRQCKEQTAFYSCILAVRTDMCLSDNS